MCSYTNGAIQKAISWYRNYTLCSKVCLNNCLKSKCQLGYAIDWINCP